VGLAVLIIHTLPKMRKWRLRRKFYYFIYTQLPPLYIQ